MAAGTVADRWGPVGTAVLALGGIIGLVILTDSFPKVGGALIVMLLIVWAYRLQKMGAFTGV